MSAAEVGAILADPVSLAYAVYRVLLFEWTDYMWMALSVSSWRSYDLHLKHSALVGNSEVRFYPLVVTGSF